jgi:hypothetical protein
VTQLQSQNRGRDHQHPRDQGSPKSVFYKILWQAGVNGILDALLAREDNSSALVLLLPVPTTCLDVRIGSEVVQHNSRKFSQPHREIIEAERIAHLLEALDDRGKDFPLKDA